MRIIHCADLHIGSAMPRVSNSAIRRSELVVALSNMVEYAHNNSVEAVLIAGDMIDGDGVSSSELANIADILTRYSDICYYIVRGNHGSQLPYNRLYQYLCDSTNVYFFGEGWTSYTQGDIVVHGIELDATSTDDIYNYIVPQPDKYNIALIHGDTTSNMYGAVDVDKLLSKCQYTALGHIHSYRVVKKTRTSQVVYSGVLEARGFDELSTSGFVLLDTATGKHQHIEQSVRSIASVTLDITGVMSSTAIQAQLSHVPYRQYLNLTLVGTLADSISLDELHSMLSSRYFAVRIVNNTTSVIDLQALSAEDSLRGNVVSNIIATTAQQLVDAGLLNVTHTTADIDRVKLDMVRVALLALAGEDISW